MPNNRQPDWAKWRLIPEWKLWEAAALSLDIEPEKVRRRAHGLAPSNFTDQAELGRRLNILDRIADAQDPRAAGLELQSRPGAPLAAKIRPSDFVRWAQECAGDWDISGELIRLAAEIQGETVKRPRTWPWGSYETEMLRKLAATAEKFWVRYTPDDPSTANRKEEIKEWLIKKHNCSGRQAEAIATVLHADGLPKGRRR